MPAYKYTLKSGKTMWYANFYADDLKGSRVHICKRGFKTQREAREYERSYVAKTCEADYMRFDDFAEVYLEDARARLKKTTFMNAEFLIRNKIIPYFGKMPLTKIEPINIRAWQTELIHEGYSPSYINSCVVRMSAIMNHALIFYGLKSNPCKAVKKVKDTKTETLNIWTNEEFELVKTKIKNKEIALILDVLFYTGMRFGELAALTPEDILESKKIRVNKNAFRSGGEIIVQDSPKTDSSVRDIDIPDFLYDEILSHISTLYGIQPHEQIFSCSSDAVRLSMDKATAMVGIHRIRIHDLRHSHVSMLIHMGYNMKLISERLGHTSIKVTMDVYGHIYEDSGKTIAHGLEGLRSGKYEL